MPKKKDTPPKQTEDQKDQAQLALIRKRASRGITGDQHNRDHIVEAKKFLDLDQWHQLDKTNRAGRPCLVIDRINPAIDQAVGDQRQNLPGLKVRPTSGGANAEWAQIKEGKIRHIVSQLDGKMAIDKASEHQLQGGIGYMRVITDYAGDDTFDQIIKLVPVYNELGVIWDPTAVAWDKMDGNWFMVYEQMSKDSYKEQYGEDPVDLEVEGDNSFLWRDEDTVIVAEYFWKEYSQKTLYLLRSGAVTELESEYPDSVYEKDKNGNKRQRKTNSYKVFGRKLDGATFLEDKQEWPSKFWPVVPAIGKEIDVEGKTKRRGITKNAMDPQRMYNYFASSGAETFALAPKAPLFATPEMIKGHEDQWKNLNTRMDPYVLVNAIDPEHPEVIQWPQRLAPPQASTAIVQGLVQAADDIRTTTGRHLASLGAQSNETSGVAIQRRQHEGDVGDFAFADNLNRAFCRVGEIILDLMPTIYDTTRNMRTLGEDYTSTNEVKINEPAEPAKGEQVSSRGYKNDMVEGKYEVIVDSGPSFSTQRTEAASFYTTIVQSSPALAAVLGDVMISNMDIPQAQMVSNRIKAEMIKGGKDYLFTEEEIADLTKKLPLLGKGPPPMPPQLIAQIQKDLQQAELYRAKAQTEMANLGMIKAETAQAVMDALEKLSLSFSGQQQPPQGQPGQGQGAPGVPKGAQVQ